MSAHEVATTIARFANSFDVKDWAGLESVLADEVEVDYGDLRGEKGRVARADYVARRRSALARLDTHHLLGNLEIEAGSDSATCRASGVIRRRAGAERFDSHVIYTFGLRRDVRGMRITSIAQRVLWSEGNPAIHAGARPDPR